MNDLKMAEKQKLFKHKTFNQQLGDVKISSLKFIERRIGLKEDDDARLSTSYLYSSLEKWIDLDCTQDFSRIISKIGGLLNVMTLAQVLNKKEELVRIIQDELKIKENSSLNSVLELLIALVQDLDDDFYVYFESTFKLLLDQLWTKNVETIENVFLTLAYLFKLLSRCMIQEGQIDLIFQLYADNLLNEQKRDYILMFASQSFAFLLRNYHSKNQTYDHLLNLMFNAIIKKPSLINGIGYLLFEVIKGVKNQLNSSANDLLPELIDKQNDKRYAHSPEVRECINYFFNAIVNYIDKNSVDPIWKVLLDKTAKLQNAQLLNNLVILQVIVNYKKCILVSDPNSIIKLLTDIYNHVGHTLDDESTNVINSLVLELLENKISILTIKNIHQFVSSVVNSKISHLNKLKFFEDLCNYNFFDRDILPELNKFLNNSLSNLNDSTLDTLLKLVLAKEFTNFKLKIDQKTSDNLLASFQSAIDLDSVWKYSVILPTIQTIPKQQLSTVLVDLLVKNLSDFNQENIERKSLLIYHLQHSIINLNDAAVFNQITPELYIQFLNEHPNQLAILKSFKLYLDNMKKFNSTLSDESRTKFEELFFNKLQPNLSHQHSQMRRTVLEILIHFTEQDENKVDNDKESIFSVCLKIEQVSFSQPRECQRLINKLDYSNSTTYLPATKNESYSFKLTPVYYLLGFYYANYTPFWETIKSVLVQYSNSHKNSNEFWKIISDHIRHTDLIIYESKFNWINETDFTNDSKLIDLEIIKLHKNEDRPDYLNHRIQLLNLLVSTPQLVDKFNRYVVQWFFEFLNNEISVLSISPTLYVEDITRLDEPMEIDGNENDEESPEVEEKEKPAKPDKNRYKIFQTFLKFLKVFSTIKNPLAIYEENKLRSLYYQLLENKDTNIQKAAFDCLKTYRFSFLTPYISNIESLIDINQFKNELVKFSFASRSSEDSLLQDLHRKDVIQVVMRILYGKLIHNFTSSKEGLVDSKLKKKLIFRYISDFREEDIRRFIEIAFNRFVNYFDLDYEDMDAKLDNLDLKQAIPCKQLYASLENLSIILDNLGSIFPNLLALFFKLIIIFLKYSCKLLSKREMIKRNSLHLLRQIRANCFKCLTTFFKTYPNFEFKSKDIDVIFDTDLERSLIQLPIDSLNYINPQLRLYLVWSEQIKFFKVLGKKLRQTDDIYPLKQIMTIYENRKANNSVIELITKIVDNLLNVHLKDEEEQVEENLEVNNVVNLDDQIETGASLLVPFIDVIINRFEQNMNRKLKSKKSSSQNLVSEVETNILLTIGKYASNEQSCFRLIKLLISSLQKNIVTSRNEDSDLNTLKIVQNLSLYVKNDVELIIASLEPFFDLIKEKNSRLCMCQILINLGKNNSSYEELSLMISGLNTYSKKIMDTFDVEEQLGTFNKVREFLSSNNFEEEKNILLINLLIKNFVFFIKNGEDHVLKEECFKTITLIVDQILKESPKLFNSICVDGLLLREVRHGLKCENDMVKQDFIQILRYIINKGKSKHRFCEQMCLLSDEDNEENDFWLNIFSIQVHQRTKATAKLLAQDELLNNFSVELITMFILPVVLNNVFDHHYSTYHSLKESSINLFGKLCKYLNWSSYAQMLTSYLKKLSNKNDDQKTIIKVICSILNNFTFNLNNVRPEVLQELELIANVKQNKENNKADKEDEEEEDDELEDQATINHHKKDNPEDILRSIVNVLLPQLHKTLNKLAVPNMTYDDDKEKKFFIEDQEILRLPIAIAMVKLLKSMPKETKLLENNIRNIILRIVNFLKSRAQSIRDSSRSTLVTVLKIIGPFYLNYVLVELRAILKRGYMFHVLTFTIYSLLNGVADQLKPLDIESSIDLIVDICNQELFSDAAEEKEVDKITSKISEAKKTRSYDVYRLIGKYISTSSLVKIYLPLKSELTQATDHKIKTKIDSCLQKLCIGVVENTFIEQHNLLLFLYGSIKDTIPELKIKQEKDKKIDAQFDRMKCLLIEPVNKQKIVKTNVRTNMHLMMLHYLQILHLTLKRSKHEKNAKNQEEKKKLIEPFVPLLVNELSSKDPQLIAMALRCLRSIILKYNNLNDAEMINLKIKNNIFILLNKYGSYIKGENLDMKTLCFKMIIVLLNRTKVEVNEDQLKILLFYCDQDILDDVKQAQAFALLNAILDRKLDCKELRELMDKLREVLIQNDIEHIRQRCRNSWFRYFLNYVIGNQLQANLLFFTKQLDYERSNGRESVLRMFLLIVKFCPSVVLLKLVKYSFIPLSLRIVNEENILCRKLTSKVLFSLFTKLPELNRTIIFKNIILPWFSSTEESIRQLSCHLLGLLCNVEKENFVINRSSNYLQLLANHLEPEQYLTMQTEETDEKLIRKHDHLIFVLLTFVKKQIRFYPELVRDSKYSLNMNSIWKYCEQSYLRHQHIWIRITANQLFSSMLSCYTNDEILNSICEPENTNDYILEDPLRVIWLFAENTLFNLSNIYDIEDESGLICKNLTRLIVLLTEIEKLDYNSLSLTEEQIRILKRLKVNWLLGRVVREIKEEVRLSTTQFKKRKIIYTWLREIIKFKLSEQQILKCLSQILKPLVRDLTDRLLHKLDKESESNKFSTAVQRVYNAIKRRVDKKEIINADGESEQIDVNRYYSKVLLKLNARKLKKKAERAKQNMHVKKPKKRYRKLGPRKLMNRKRKSTDAHYSSKRRRIE